MRQAGFNFFCSILLFLKPPIFISTLFYYARFKIAKKSIYFWCENRILYSYDTIYLKFS